MKFFLIALLVMNVALAANPDILKDKMPQATSYNLVDAVRSMDAEGDHFRVTFWESAKVHRIPKSNEHTPCLENGWKSNRPVTLNMSSRGEVLDCKLFGGTHPGVNPKRHNL